MRGSTGYGSQPFVKFQSAVSHEEGQIIYPQKFLIKSPVAAYYFLTFLISWGGVVIIMGVPNKITSQPATAPFLPLYFASVAGPSIAGFLLTGLYYGKRGYRNFFSRPFKWRVQAKWYGTALLIAPFTVFATLFVLLLFSQVFKPVYSAR